MRAACGDPLRDDDIEGEGPFPSLPVVIPDERAPARAIRDPPAAPSAAPLANNRRGVGPGQPRLRHGFRVTTKKRGTTEAAGPITDLMTTRERRVTH